MIWTQLSVALLALIGVIALPTVGAIAAGVALFLVLLDLTMAFERFDS